MTKQNASELSLRMFGERIDRYCNSVWGDGSQIEACRLSVLYGSSQDEDSKFKPTPGAFDLAKKPLQTLTLTFYRDKLFKIDGIWHSLSSEDAAAAILHAFTVKFGKSNPRQKLKPLTSQAEPGWQNAMYRARHTWVDKVTSVSVTFEAIDYTDSKAKSTTRVIGVDAEFEIVDSVTQAFVEKESKPANDKAAREFIRKGLGM